jgi:endonuclease/exonuclease/phosphatase family metal-dependent hydrolase
MGITFPNIKAPLRIDYILHSRELPSFDYHIGNVMHSDHKPVSCVIAVGR